MNFFQDKSAESEKLSLDKTAKIENNLILSQNLLAVMPNGLNWLFLRPSIAQRGIGVNPSYLGVRLVCMVWLILQNKPIGKYAKRLLVKPRVRPHRPNLGYQLNNLLGVFQ